MIINPYIFTTSVSLDPDAQAFITTGSITDATEQEAINELVLELKGQGTINSTIDFWTTFTSESWARIFPFVGGTIDAHKLDLLNPGSNNLVFYGGVTHDAGGVNGNVTNGYYEIYPNSSVIPVDDLMLSTYVAGNSTVQGSGVMGVYNEITAKQIQHNVRYNTTTFRYYPMSGFARDAPDSAPFEGYYSFKTDGATDTANVKGAYTSQAAFTPGVGNPNAKVTGLGLYYAGYTNGVPFPSGRTDRWVSFLPHLSDADETVFKQIVDQFQNKLGRKVDPDAAAYISSLRTKGYNVSNTEYIAINNHFLDLKGQGPNNSTYDWWSGCVRLLPFIGTNAAQQGIKGENPASSINFYGGMIFSSIGAEGNGTNAYFDFFAPNELPDDRNNSIWVYETKNLAPTNYIQYTLYRGYFDQRFEGGLINAYQITTQYIQNRTYCLHGDSYNSITTPDGSLVPPSTGGLFGASRYKSFAEGGGFDLYAKGVKYTMPNDINSQYNTSAQIVPGLANRTYLSYTQGVNNFQPLAFGYALITTGVSTEEEAAALKTSVEAFMTALGRNV